MLILFAQAELIPAIICQEPLDDPGHLEPWTSARSRTARRSPLTGAERWLFYQFGAWTVTLNRLKWVTCTSYEVLILVWTCLVVLLPHFYVTVIVLLVVPCLAFIYNYNLHSLAFSRRVWCVRCVCVPQPLLAKSCPGGNSTSPRAFFSVVPMAYDTPETPQNLLPIQCLSARAGVSLLRMCIQCLACI